MIDRRSMRGSGDAVIDPHVPSSGQWVRLVDFEGKRNRSRNQGSTARPRGILDISSRFPLVRVDIREVHTACKARLRSYKYSVNSVTADVMSAAFGAVADCRSNARRPQPLSSGLAEPPSLRQCYSERAMNSELRNRNDRQH